MPGSKPYRFHPHAWLELEAANGWYRQRSPESSVRFLAAVYDGLESLAQSPQRWPKWLRGTRRFILHNFPFSVIYRDESAVVNVVAPATIGASLDIGRLGFSRPSHLVQTG